MTNRMLQVCYGKRREVYHLYHLVRCGRRMYLIYANRAESETVMVGCAKRRPGGWRFWECDEELFLPEQALTPLLTECDPDVPCAVWELDRKTGRLSRRGVRTAPFAARPQGWSWPYFALWLALSVGAALILLRFYDLRGWVLAVAGRLTRQQADLLVLGALPLLSLGYLLLCSPSVLSVVYGLAFAVTVLVLPGVWKLGITGLNIGLIMSLVGGALLAVGTLLAAGHQRLPSRKRKLRCEGFQQLAAGFLGVVMLCVGCVMPQLDPPAIAAAAQQPPGVAQHPRTEAEALMIYRQQVLPQLTEEVWQTLALQQRIDLLQQVVDYEAGWQLHCDSLPVQIRVADSEDTLAYYDGEAINLDRDHLLNRTVGQTVQSALHELRHHYQYQVAAMLQAVEQQLPEYAQLAYFDTARRYTANMEDYVSSDDDLTGYYYQLMEQDARAYAAERYETFYQEQIAPESADTGA